jgi:hypothetical protein
MSQGQGNITFSGLSTNAGSSGGGGGSATAHNGVSIDGGGFVQLGNVAGDPGQPGQLLSQQEIDLNGFGLQFDWPSSAVSSLFQITAGGIAILEFYKGLTGQDFLEIITIQGKNPGLNPYGNFWVTLDESYIAPDGQRDAVLQWGYNQNGGGGVMLAGECEVHYAIESHFNEAGSYQNEIHLESTSRGGDKNRIYSFDVNIFNGNTTGYFTTNSLNFFASGPLGVPYFSIDNTGTTIANGPGANLQIINPTAGFANFIVNLNADGSVNITGAGGTNPTYNFDKGLNVSTPSALVPAYDTELANADGVQGFSATGTVSAGSGLALPFFSQMSATGTVAGFVQNLGAGDAGWVSRVAVGTGNAFFQVSNASTALAYSFGLEQTSGFFKLALGTNVLAANLLTITPTAQAGFGGETTPTALVHIAASPGTPGTGPLKLTPAPLLAVPEDGLIEYDGTNFWKTIGAVRTIIT